MTAKEIIIRVILLWTKPAPSTNVVVEDMVLDGENAIVIEQANNRTYAAQFVLKNILENLS